MQTSEEHFLRLGQPLSSAVCHWRSWQSVWKLLVKIHRSVLSSDGHCGPNSGRSGKLHFQTFIASPVIFRHLLSLFPLTLLEIRQVLSCGLCSHHVGQSCIMRPHYVRAVQRPSRAAGALFALQELIIKAQFFFVKCHHWKNMILIYQTMPDSSHLLFHSNNWVTYVWTWKIGKKNLAGLRWT